MQGTGAFSRRRALGAITVGLNFGTRDLCQQQASRVRWHDHACFLLGFLLAFVGPACGSAELPAKECDDGDERCACFSNGTCQNGLECRSGLCVAPDTTSTGGSGGVPAAECGVGDQGCECYSNGTCNQSLECLSGLCVDPGATGGGDDGSGGGGGDGGGAVEHGACFPADECFAPGKTGSWAGAECIAVADNKGHNHAQLRVSQLLFQSPAVMTQPFMQTTVVTENITPTRQNQACRQMGTNRFNILFDFDFQRMEMKQGTAIPQALLDHEIGQGTCWADYTGANPADLKSKIVPSVAPFTFDASTGRFEATFATMNLPIYVADTEDDFALFPLRELVVSGTLSAGNSCIGKYRADDLSPPSCAPDAYGPSWEDAGRYVGYITVADADTVDVSSLGFSLCTLLSGDSVKWKNQERDIGRCINSRGYQENGNRMPEGDWCSVSNSADANACGGVWDAWLLDTTFAASGVRIDGRCPTGG